MQRIALRITGRVQGVRYRKTTFEKAKAYGLKGFVRNEPDGSVYVVAEGERTGLDKLIDWCRQGPPASMVSEIAFLPADPNEAFLDFNIRY